MNILWFMASMPAVVLGIRKSGGGDANMVVATATNDGYAYSALNLAKSAIYWGASKVVVYDLGMSDANKKMLRDCGLLVREGKWNPDWQHSVKDFGWKGYVIRDAVDEEGEVLYLDAGSEVRGDLAPLFQIIWQDGTLLFTGQDAGARRWTHPDAAAALGISMDVLTGPDGKELGSLWAGGQGWKKGSQPYTDILVPWALACESKDKIAPSGSDLSNHRQDQTALTLIAYNAGWKTFHTDLLAASRPQGTREESSEQVVWTARGSNGEYSDQACLSAQ